MNGEKLFKSMNNINQEWIEQAKPANKPVIMRTRSKIYRNIAAAAAAVIAISGLTYTFDIYDCTLVCNISRICTYCIVRSASYVSVI